MNQTHPSIDQIVDYLHGELAAVEDAAIHTHLAACRECEERRLEEVSLTEALRAHARATEREMPLDLRANIRRRIERPSTRGVSRRLHLAFRPIVIFPAAAAIAAIFYAGFDVWRDLAAPNSTIDAAYYVQNHAAMAATAPFGDDTPMFTADEQTR